MIGSIRKHSTWLWWIIAGLTIVSFVWYMGTPNTRTGSGRVSAGFGTLYGKPISEADFAAAQREYYILYWMQRHEFPLNEPKTDMDKDIYVRLMLKAKAKALGIHPTEASEEAVAASFLHSLGGRDGESVPMSLFLQKVLQPYGLTAADFQQAIIDNLAMEQLQQSLGLPGALITPQEGSDIYDREHREYSTEAMFFPASNYLSQVKADPAAIAEFYTNKMATYRLPERAQVNYIVFDLSNFTAQAAEKLGKTNIEAQAESYYAQKGAAAVPDAKTPEEAKARLRDMIVRQQAGEMAVDQAKQFLGTLFAMDPVQPENFVSLARTNHLVVHETAPFNQITGPAEFPESVASQMASDAFALNADSPFGIKPIASTNAIYVIGLAGRLPSEIQPLDTIYSRVASDYKDYEATEKARAAGTNFDREASVQLAAGQSFVTAASAAGRAPVALTFSLSSQDVPEAESHVDLRTLKNAAVTTQPGHASQFITTPDGGFVLFVRSMLPVDEAAKTAAMPQFLSDLRNRSQSDAFELWLETEASRELKSTPVYAELTGNKTVPKSP